MPVLGKVGNKEGDTSVWKMLTTDCLEKKYGLLDDIVRSLLGFFAQRLSSHAMLSMRGAAQKTPISPRGIAQT